MNAPERPLEPRLTALSHGGGCGCKIAPGVLAQILKGTAGMVMPKELLVGIETADDAAVYQLNDEQALIATTDFFMPIVDDPFDFGRIAATNAISDVYAMGGRPIMALALVGMPINVLSTQTIGRILEGRPVSQGGKDHTSHRFVALGMEEKPISAHISCCFTANCSSVRWNCQGYPKSSSRASPVKTVLTPFSLSKVKPI